MTLDSTLAGIITAAASAFTAIALVITAIAGLVRSRKVEAKVDQVQATGEENHKMLNQRYTDMVNYQRALVRALEDKDIAVPIDQSIAEPTKPPANLT